MATPHVLVLKIADHGVSKYDPPVVSVIVENKDFWDIKVGNMIVVINSIETIIGGYAYARDVTDHTLTSFVTYLKYCGVTVLGTVMDEDENSFDVWNY